jgi:hypothetical protein
VIFDSTELPGHRADSSSELSGAPTVLSAATRSSGRSSGPQVSRWLPLLHLPSKWRCQLLPELTGHSDILSVCPTPNH